MTLHVSVTGIQLKEDYDHSIVMAFLSLIPSQKLAEAGTIPGLVAAEVDCSHGMHYTMCTWVNKESMNRYLCSLKHMQALKVSLELGSVVKEHTFVTAAMPFWTSSVRKEWETKGRTLFQQDSPHKMKSYIVSTFPRYASQSGRKIRKHQMSRSSAVVRTKRYAVAPIA